MEPKSLKITVKENKNSKLAYPHLKQSIENPGLIVLFNTEYTGIVISVKEHEHFKLGMKCNVLKPETFKIFRGIITLTQ